MASLPTPPAPGSSYASGTGVNYVNILDGVAGSALFSNANGSPAQGYECEMVLDNVSPVRVANASLLTTDQSATPAPLSWQYVSSIAPAVSWQNSAISVKVTGNTSNGQPIVAAAYDGSALPSMPSGVTPAGVCIVEQPWQVESGTTVAGYVDPNPSSHPNAFHRIFFVPNFLMEGGTVSGGLNSDTASTITYTLAKPLNKHQAPTVTATLTGLNSAAAGATVTPTLVTNSYGQITAIQVALTANQIGNGYTSSASGSLTLNATMPLTYLKGTVLTTETVNLLNNKVIILSVATVTGSKIAIPTFNITNAGHLNEVAGGTFWAQGTDPVIGAFEALGGVNWLAFTVTQDPSMAPIASVKLTLQPTTGGLYAYTGAAKDLATWTPQTSAENYNMSRSTTWGFPSNFVIGTIMKFKLLLTAYDTLGNTVSQNAISGTAVNTDFYYVNLPNVYGAAIASGFIHSSAGVVTASADGWFFSPNGGFNLYADNGGTKTWPNGTLVGNCQTFGTTSDIRYPTSFTGAISITIAAGNSAIPINSDTELWFSAVTVTHGEYMYPDAAGTAVTASPYSVTPPDPNCVPAGTMLETAEGPVPIELVKVGDLVRGYDEYTLEPLTTPVTHHFAYPPADLWQFTTEHGTIVASSEHRPWRKRVWEGPEEGIGHYPPLRHFVPGDITLWEVDGALVESAVLAVEDLHRQEPVFHLSMDEGHMYVAGSLPAHNSQNKQKTQ